MASGRFVNPHCTVIVADCCPFMIGGMRGSKGKGGNRYIGNLLPKWEEPACPHSYVVILCMC